MIELRIYAHGDCLSGSQQLRPMLELLKHGPFPPLNSARRTDMKDIKPKTFTDESVLKFLDKRKFAIDFIDTNGKFIAHIIQMPGDETIIGVDYNSTENINFFALIQFFKSSVTATNPFIAEVSLEPESIDFVRSHYSENRRTFRSPGLIWLQYYAGEELERQGGIEAIEKNPLIRSERFHEGLIVQVGESPLDILTIPGRALLVKATEAMPPVKAYS